MMAAHSTASATRRSEANPQAARRSRGSHSLMTSALALPKASMITCWADCSTARHHASQSSTLNRVRPRSRSHQLLQAMQSAGQQCSCRALPRSGAKHPRPPLASRRPVPNWAGRRQQACTCSAEQRNADLSRREALLAFGGAAAVAWTPLPSSAEEGGACIAAGHGSGVHSLSSQYQIEKFSWSIAETKTLYGRASPPTSYGGYGGNAKEAAK